MKIKKQWFLSGQGQGHIDGRYELFENWWINGDSIKMNKSNQGKTEQKLQFE